MVGVALVPGDGGLGADEADQVLEVEAAAEGHADGPADGARGVDVGGALDVVAGDLALREAAAAAAAAGGAVAGVGGDGGDGDGVVVAEVEVVVGPDAGARDDDGGDGAADGGKGGDLPLVARELVLGEVCKLFVREEGFGKGVFEPRSSSERWHAPRRG